MFAFLVSAAVVNADCWRVSRSRAVNDYGSGTGWCEGCSSLDCTYCWTTEGNGGSCSTNTIWTCTPTEEHRN
jgi:hypothetical protein